MTTTHASTHAPKPAEGASKPAQQGSNARANADKPAEDLFASLLSLVSDTHQAPTGSDGDTAVDAAAEADDLPDDNPLAALLAWGLPGSTPSATGTGAAAAPTPGKAEGAAREGGIDVSGMTRVDEAAPALPNAAAQARAAAASRPAFSPLNPNAATPSPTAAAQRAADGNALQGGAPAMVWQRGAVSSTDALQQQQSAQFAQVRATVALNERLGVASTGAEVGPNPTNPREFALSGPAASATATGPAQDGSLTAASGTAPGDSSGGGSDASSQSFTDQGNGDGRPQTGAETEAPTVSHWGTQHMRHASLRVGGEGTDAIDIQLAVKGQEVQVAFQTDNAEARATLRESAGDSLADLLQRSGIQLGGVSVGSQGQAQGDGSPHQPRAAGLSTEALGRASQAAEPATRPVLTPRTDGSRPLDVFA